MSKILCRICKEDMTAGTIPHWQKFHPKEYLKGSNELKARKRELGIQ